MTRQLAAARNQAEQDKYGNIAVGAMSPRAKGYVISKGMGTDEVLNGSCVIVDTTTFEEYLRRQREFGNPTPPDEEEYRYYYYYLAVAE